MNLKDGDVVTIDGIEMEVTNAVSDGYFFKERSSDIYYYSMIFYSSDDISKMHVSGRFFLGPVKAVTPGKTACSYHTWKKYVGVRDVYDYCTRCDAKRDREWRNIKDEKEY